MKKLIIYLMCIFLLVGCSFTDKNEGDILEDFKAELTNLNITSSSVKFSVSSNLNNLEYKLFLEDELITQGSVLETNEINNLESNTTYTLTLYNTIYSESFEIKTNEIISLNFTGDVLLGLFFGDYIKQYGVNYPWENVSDVLNNADISMINLETSVSERGSSTKSEGFGFRSLPYTLEGLNNSGIDIVSLANNHVIDYGYDAFNDTMKNLNNYNIKYVGAGSNITDALSEECFTIKGKVICYMASTEILGYSHWIADNDKEGVLPFNDNYYDMIINQIKAVKEKCDYLVFNVHWGIEYDNYPKQYQIDLAHLLIDNGVDILIGHHPHVLQGIEYYNNGIIFYSLGNFIFLFSNDNSTRGGIFEVNIDGNNITSKVYPTNINYCKANLLDKSDEEYNIIINSLNERSKDFNTIIDEYGNIKHQDS